MQTAARACRRISHKMLHGTVQRVQRLIDHTHLVQLYSCCNNRLPRRYLKPKQDKCVLVIIFAFKKHSKNGVTGRIPLGMPPNKRTTIKVFHSIKKKTVIPMTHRHGSLNTTLPQKCSLLLQGNYFNFRFLDTSNTDGGGELRIYMYTSFMMSNFCAVWAFVRNYT